MKYIEFDNRATGWVSTPGYVKTLRVVFNNGEKIDMSSVDFVLMPKRLKDKVVKIGYEEIPKKGL